MKYRSRMYCASCGKADPAPVFIEDTPYCLMCLESTHDTRTIVYYDGEHDTIDELEDVRDNYPYYKGWEW